MEFSEESLKSEDKSVELNVEVVVQTELQFQLSSNLMNLSHFENDQQLKNSKSEDFRNPFEIPIQQEGTSETI